MKAIYVDLHIHTSENADALNTDYDATLLVENILKFCNTENILISLTDHNTLNEGAYKSLLKNDINVLLGVELHIRNYDDRDPYHCHMYFDIERDKIIDNIASINKLLDKLYPNKMVTGNSKIPKLEDVVKEFDKYDFLLLPHGGQSHNTFNKSILKE